jgi:hypothetical protein
MIGGIVGGGLNAAAVSCQNLLLQSLLSPHTELYKINPIKVPHPKNFMGFLADVQEGDNPEECPTYEDADR